MAVRTDSGFSLVELSIVLVILGLLTGGILAGQSLIRAAELRSVTTEYQRWVTATQTFRDKYMALPGDIRNASQFWKLSTACSGTEADGVCNGDGNGSILSPTVNPIAATPSEAMQFWRHLAKAGLIEGDYLGTGATLTDADCGTTSCPASKIANAYWGVRAYPATVTPAYFDLPDNQPGNHFTVGARDSNGWPHSAIFRPEEAWNIDVKLDDGKPAYGRVLSLLFADCTQATVRTQLDADYNLANPGKVCRLYFKW